MTSMVMTCCNEKKQNAEATKSQRHERAVGNAVARMHRGQHTKVVAVAGGSEGYARVAKQQREHRSKRSPHDERGHEPACPNAESRPRNIGHELQVQRRGGIGLRHLRRIAHAGSAARFMAKYKR